MIVSRWDGINFYTYRRRMNDLANMSPTPEAIQILRELYLLPVQRPDILQVCLRPDERPTALGTAIVNDPDCLQFFADIWDYNTVKYGGSGNISQFGMNGFIDMVLNPDDILDYLYSDGEACAGSEQRNLAIRLTDLNRRYTEVRNAWNRRGRR